MRHNKKFNHLGRTASHRNAMLANMAISLIMHKRITTTLAKAKALKKYVEPLITRSKDDTTNSRRVVFSYLQNKFAVTELFKVISEKVANPLLRCASSSSLTSMRTWLRHQRLLRRLVVAVRLQLLRLLQQRHQLQRLQRHLQRSQRLNNVPNTFFHNNDAFQIIGKRHFLLNVIRQKREADLLLAQLSQVV